MFAGLLMSATSFADVKPITPYCILDCYAPEIPLYYSYGLGDPDNAILDIKGAVKTVRVQGKNLIKVFTFNKQGMITNSIEDRYFLWAEIKYKYDDKNRLLSLISTNSKGRVIISDEYSYIDDKNMLVKHQYDGNGNWTKSIAVVKSQDQNGNTIYYKLYAGDDTTFANKYILSKDGSKFVTTFLIGDNKEHLKTETDADKTILNELKCLQENECGAGLSFKTYKNVVSKSKDGELIKFTNGDENTIDTTMWFKNGLLVEQVGMYEEFPDGTTPHGHLVYTTDKHGNWTKVETYIDTPATLTNPKPRSSLDESKTITRQIEYYN